MKVILNPFTGKLEVLTGDVALKASAAALTAGQVLFPDINGFIIQDSNLFWDNTNKRLGIGTTIPGTLLDVKGTGGIIRTQSGNGNPTARMGHISATDAGGVEIYNGGVSTVLIATNQNSYFLGGNIGIGTVTPASALSINGAAGKGAPVQGGGMIFLNATEGSPGSGGGLLFGGIGSNSFFAGIKGYLIDGSNQTTGNLVFYTRNSNTSMSLTERIRITDIGNVGIGTTPGVKLDIKGTGAGAQKVNIQDPLGGSFAFDMQGVGVTSRTAIYYGIGAIANTEIISLPNFGPTAGFIGIATTTPNQQLEVNGRVRIDTITADGTAAAYFNASGDLGVITSDKRLKKNIKPITNALDKVKGINGVTYEWAKKEQILGDPGRHYGVIAQDVMKVAPELTFKSFEKRGKPYYGVHYERLTALLIEAVKELSSRLEIAESKLTKAGL